MNRGQRDTIPRKDDHGSYAPTTSLNATFQQGVAMKEIAKENINVPFITIGVGRRRGMIKEVLIPIHTTNAAIKGTFYRIFGANLLIEYDQYKTSNNKTA